MNDWDIADVMKDMEEFKEAMKDDPQFPGFGLNGLKIFNEKDNNAVEQYFKDHPDEPIFQTNEGLFIRNKDYNDLKKYLLKK